VTDGDANRGTLRPYREADLPYLLDIAVAAWQPIFDSYQALLGSDLFDAAFPDWQADKRRQIESACRGDHNAQVAVVELEGQPVGFITYYLNRRPGVGEIGNNAVHPDHQNAGIATRMYRHALAHMRAAGMRCAKVTTGGDPSHAPARRAYEKAGFERALPSVDYYLKL
jgi:ribosomal protein S18 acetylase RimI-like enzyme